MASLYKRKDSPYFWINYLKDGVRTCESTGFRVTVALDVRKARELEAQRTLEEVRQGSAKSRWSEGAPSQGPLRGWFWVQPWLEVRYAQSLSTLERYLTNWKTVRIFLAERDIDSPANFTRQHCYDYLKWRTLPTKEESGRYRACHNTALLELKLIRIVLQEALVRGLIQGNPCVKLGLKKETAGLKPAFTQEDDALIRAEIAKVVEPFERDLLETSFEIARYQGCRLQETQLNPMTAVDLQRSTITFHAKGGHNFTTALHPKLVPLFQKLQRERRRCTWEPPPNTKYPRQWASMKWYKFLKRIGLKERGITFHGLRVTVITELARANVPLSKAKKFVGHSSTTVHEIYQRLRPEDVFDVTAAVGG